MQVTKDGIRYGRSMTRNGVMMQLEKHQDLSLWVVIRQWGEKEGRFMRLPIDRDGWESIRTFIGG